MFGLIVECCFWFVVSLLSASCTFIVVCCFGVCSWSFVCLFICLLFVVCFVVRCPFVLFVVCCLPRAVRYCGLFVDCCELCVICCLLRVCVVVCCVPYVVSFVMFVVCWLLCVVYCMLSRVYSIMHGVCHFWLFLLTCGRFCIR